MLRRACVLPSPYGDSTQHVRIPKCCLLFARRLPALASTVVTVNVCEPISYISEATPFLCGLFQYLHFLWSYAGIRWCHTLLCDCTFRLTMLENGVHASISHPSQWFDDRHPDQGFMSECVIFGCSFSFSNYMHLAVYHLNRAVDMILFERVT